MLQKEKTAKGKRSLQEQDKQNVCLANSLDVDLNITSSKTVQNNLKIIRNTARIMYVLKNKKVHATTAKILMTKRYTHIWHECLLMTNVLEEILVAVQLDFRFWSNVPHDAGSFRFYLRYIRR